MSECRFLRHNFLWNIEVSGQNDIRGLGMSNEGFGIGDTYQIVANLFAFGAGFHRNQWFTRIEA